MDLERRLIGLVAATLGDGGKALRRALRADLGELAPYDRGEVAFLRDERIDRWRLDDDPEAVAGDDLVRHLAAQPAPVRIDDLHESEPFAQTCASMENLGLRSLLALPLSDAGGVVGALVLARDYGWAFAGAPLRVLLPIAAMTGLCVDRALQLTLSGARPTRSRPTR
jgi:GAF domain-containing protein